LPSARFCPPRGLVLYLDMIFYQWDLGGWGCCWSVLLMSDVGGGAPSVLLPLAFMKGECNSC
jgi:hypothetical protein